SDLVTERRALVADVDLQLICPRCTAGRVPGVGVGRAVGADDRPIDQEPVLGRAGAARGRGQDYGRAGALRRGPVRGQAGRAASEIGEVDDAPRLVAGRGALVAHVDLEAVGPRRLPGRVPGKGVGGA